MFVPLVVPCVPLVLAVLVELVLFPPALLVLLLPVPCPVPFPLVDSLLLPVLLPFSFLWGVISEGVCSRWCGGFLPCGCDS